MTNSNSKINIRYGIIKKKVQSIYLEHKIDRLPIQLSNIIKAHNNWKIWTYKEFGRKNNLSLTEVIDLTGSPDGCAYYQAKKDRFLILYNTDPHFINNQNRMKWTIAHEIGHIVLNHHSENEESIICRSNLSDEKYDLLEREANYFASSLLAPIPILKLCNILKKTEIIQVCKLSNEAALYKEEYLKNNQKTYINDNDIRIIKLFHNFINRKHCLVCGYSFYNKKANYCPICGNNKLKWEEGNLIYDDGYSLNERGRSDTCPVCGNTEMLSEGEHCRICGTYLVNKCTKTAEYDEYGNCYEQGCAILAHSNSRFCEICGSPTTFFRDSLLDPWQTAREAILTEEASNQRITCENFREVTNWNEILNDFKNIGRMALYTNLLDTKACFYNEYVLIIFPSSSNSTFSKVIISKKENTELIEQTINKHFINSDYHIKTICQDTFKTDLLLIDDNANADTNFLEKVRTLSKNLDIKMTVID